jgi:hypothetical protein
MFEIEKVTFKAFLKYHLHYLHWMSLITDVVNLRRIQRLIQHYRISFVILYTNTYNRFRCSSSQILKHIRIDCISKGPKQPRHPGGTTKPLPRHKIEHRVGSTIFWRHLMSVWPRDKRRPPQPLFVFHYDFLRFFHHYFHMKVQRTHNQRTNKALRMAVKLQLRHGHRLYIYIQIRKSMLYGGQQSLYCHLCVVTEVKTTMTRQYAPCAQHLY